MNAIVNTTAVELVAEGGMFLDQHWPNWWMEVDLSTLDLASTCDCVLGQLGVDFGRAMRRFHVAERPTPTFPGHLETGFELFDRVIFPRLGLTDDRAMERLGFEESSRATYEELQGAWVDLIIERRLAASVI